MNEISKEIRFTIDIHEANRVIKRERHPMKTLINTKNNAKFMSKVDMSGPYQQLLLSQSCRYITGFVTPWGVFQFK